MLFYCQHMVFMYIKFQFHLEILNWIWIVGLSLMWQRPLLPTRAHASCRLFSLLLPGSSLQGVHRCVHEFWARPPQRWWLLALSLHESYGIHAQVLLTALVHGLHVTNTAVGSFYCPVSLQAQWTSVYCLIRRTAWPWVRIHWFAQSGDRTPVSGTASSVSA